MYEYGVPGGALHLNSTGYADHGHYGDIPLQGKIPTAEPGIKPGPSWLVVRRSDHQATRLVSVNECTFRKFITAILNCLILNNVLFALEGYYTL
jgi:hypothetical protein